MKALICPAPWARGKSQDRWISIRRRQGPARLSSTSSTPPLNFFDTLIIEGKYQLKPEPPFSPAGEFSGRVAAIGAGVTQFKVGDRVMGSTGFGAAREKIAVAANRLAHVPPGLALDKAAGLAIAYGTSLHALKQRAEMKPGKLSRCSAPRAASGLRRSKSARPWAQE